MVVRSTLIDMDLIQIGFLNAVHAPIYGDPYFADKVTDTKLY